MKNQDEIVQQAKALSKEKRKQILMSFRETELHVHLKALFDSMQPDYTTAVTHGSTEFGKDLVIVKKDKLGIDVTGVVVKTGDIKGKTSGHVDNVIAKVNAVLTASEEKKIAEIESQYQQALAHPAMIPTIFRLLPVNKALIILAGEISENARKRLLAELPISPEHIQDIEWLINNFTDFYPQVYFGEKTIDFLQKQIQILENRHWLSKRKINLSEYFVEPIVASGYSPIQLDAKTFDHLLHRQKIPLLKLRTLLKHSAKLLLTGDPITGKSGSLTKLAIDMLRETASDAFSGKIAGKDIEIPVLVTAKQVLDAGSKDILLSQVVGEADLIGRIKVKILMVDGLDEVHSDKRQVTLDKAILFAKEFDSALVITSRKLAMFNKLPPGFQDYELLPFETSQALQLFNKLLSGKKESLKTLKEGLEKISYHIPMVPLSLMFLIELVEKHNEIPASVTELYDRFCDLALGKEDKDKGIEILFEYIIKKRFIASLAFKEFLSKERLEITIGEFHAFLDSYAQNYDWGMADLPGFIKEIERTGLLTMKEMVSFPHRSFVDYFAASYIYENRDDFDDINKFIVEIYFNDTWGETPFFYIGLKREIGEQLLNRIFSYSKDDLPSDVNKFSIGRMLQAGWHSPSKIKHEGIINAIAYAPAIREKLIKLADTSGNKLPKIFADIILMGFAEVCYGSGFLYKEVRGNYVALLGSSKPENMLPILIMLFSLKRFLNKAELHDEINNCLGWAANHGNVEDQIKAVMFLMIIERDDRAVLKSLRAKLRKLSHKYPDVIKKLLPQGKSGFRRIKHKP